MKESKDIQLLFEGDRCTLVLREAYLEDSGTYKCVARNDHGQAESGCKLHVEGEWNLISNHSLPNLHDFMHLASYPDQSNMVGLLV